MFNVELKFPIVHILHEKGIFFHVKYRNFDCFNYFLKFEHQISKIINNLWHAVCLQWSTLFPNEKQKQRKRSNRPNVERLKPTMSIHSPRVCLLIPNAEQYFTKSLYHPRLVSRSLDSSLQSNRKQTCPRGRLITVIIIHTNQEQPSFEASPSPSTILHVVLVIQICSPFHKYYITF